MANDIKDRSSKEDNPVQKHYDSEFDKLTSGEHLSKDGTPGALSHKSDKKPEDSTKPVDLGDSEKRSTESKSENSGLFSASPSPAGKKGLGKFVTKKRAGIFGGATGVVIVLAVYMFSIVSGPLQIIHISQILLPDFDGISEMGDARSSRLLRHMYYGQSQVERTRLGVVGNRVADKIETKLASDGISILKNNAGYMVDIEVDGKPLGLADVDLNGKPTKNAAYRNSLRKILKAKGYGATATALLSRPVFYRYGVDFRPLGNIKRNTNESFTDFRARVKDDIDGRIKNGTFETTVRNLDETRQELETQRAEAEARGDTVRAEELRIQLEEIDAVGTDYKEFFDGQREIAEDFKNSADPDDVKIKRATDSLVGKYAGKGSAIVAIVGLSVCFTNGISKQIKFGEYVNRYLPQMRMGLRAISIGQQIFTGQNVDPDEVRVIAENLTNTEGKSWSAGEQINYKINGEMTGVPSSPTILVGEADDSAWVKVGDYLDFPGVDPVCGLMGNVVFQAGLAIGEGLVSVFTGGTAAVVKVAAQEAAQEAFSRFLLSPVGEGIVRSVVGAEVPSDASGPLYGNIIAQGSFFAANESAREMGGFSLSSEQEALLQDYVEDQNPERFAHRSTYDKLFNPKLPTSILGIALMKGYSSTSGLLDIVNPVNMFRNITSSVASLFNDNASAGADDLPYSGVPKVGFTVDEIESTVAEDPYENAEDLIDKYGSEAELAATFSDCFAEAPSVLNPDVDSNYFIVDNLCGNRGTSFTEDLYRYRMYLLDQKTLLSLGCFAEDESSCTELGVN